MTDSALYDKILDLAKPLADAQGLKIWGLELVPGGRLTVRLYLDGVNIDQCESVSRQLGLAMEVENLIAQAWTLEISSPGLERPFFELCQLKNYLGEIIEVSLASPLAEDAQASSRGAISGRKHWRGHLLALDDNTFSLEPCDITAEGEVIFEGREAVRIPWAQVRRARRVEIFRQPQKPGKTSAGLSRRKKSKDVNREIISENNSEKSVPTTAIQPNLSQGDSRRQA